MGREGGLFGKKQGSNMPECFSKSSRSKTKDLVESFRMKTTTTTVTRSMLMSRNVKKFDTLSFNSAFYQSAIASRRNEEIESYRRWMLIKSTFQYFLSSSFYFSSFFLNHLSISVGFVFFWGSAFPLSYVEKWFSTKCQTYFSPVSVSSGLSSKDNSIESTDDP